MRDQEELTILTGLLDFFSDRATAHASFVVATMFGIYAILTAKNYLPFMVLTAAYIAMVVFGLYSFLNFGLYAAYARIIRIKLEGQYREEIEKSIGEKLGKSFPFFSKFATYKKYGLKGKLKMAILFMLWLLSVIAPLFWLVFPFIPELVGLILAIFAFIFGLLTIVRALWLQATEKTD